MGEAKRARDGLQVRGAGTAFLVAAFRSATRRNSLGQEFALVSELRAKEHPQPGSVQQFWFDGFAAYCVSFTIWGAAIIAASVLDPDLRGGEAAIWLQGPWVLIVAGGAMALYMAMRVDGRNFGWKLIPTLGAYLAGLAGGGLMAILLWIGTW